MATTDTLFSSLPARTGPHVGPVAVGVGRSPGRGWASVGRRVVAGAAVVMAVAVITTGQRVGAAGVNVSWTRVAGTEPPALRGAAAAYDTDNRTVVLFGGTRSDGTPSDQTWVFDGAHWALSSGSAPSARTGASMAFDAAAHQLILFGGQDAGGAYLGDTWAWNGAQWFPASPTTPPPPARSGASLAVDPSGSLVLFGGTGAAPDAGTPPGAAPSPAATPPAGPTGSQAVHSAAAAPVALGDTWTWSGTTWTQAGAAGAPPARTGAAMTYDALRHRTVLFGGAAQTGGPAGNVGDTWLWDGTAWTQAAPASSPPARSAAALVGDTVVAGAVLIGGSVNGSAIDDSWLWDGSTWTPISPGSPPPATAAAGSAFDAATGQVLLVGGIGANGTPGTGSYLLGVPPPAAPPPVSPPPPTTIPTPQPTVPTALGRPGRSVPPFTSPVTRPAAAPSTTVPPPAGGRRPAPLAAEPSAPPVRALRPGAPIVLLGAGFMPGALIDISFHSVPEQVATVTASSAGTFSVTVLVPRGADPGDHHFVMTGPSPSGAQTSISTPVLVMAVTAAPGPGLQTPIMVGIAVLLPVGTWVAMVVLGRRRQGAPGPP